MKEVGVNHYFKTSLSLNICIIPYYHTPIKHKTRISSVFCVFVLAMDVFKAPDWKQILQEFEWLKLSLAQSIVTV